MWTEERVGELTRYWREGMTASQVADRLGGVTRNAVIGKAHRIGLVKRVPVLSPKQRMAALRQREVEKAAAEARRQEQAAKRAKEEAWKALRQSFKETPPPADVALVASVLDLESQHCRWPIDTPDGMGFCGCEKVVGSYCQAHAALAFTGPPDREKRTNAYTHPSTRAFGG